MFELLHRLLHDFGAEIGLPQLAPDDQGFCSLQIGERVTVSIQYEPEEQDLALFTRVAQIDAEFRPEAYEMMLAGNLFWAATGGGTLAIESETGSVFLLMKDKIQTIDGSRFRAMLTKFVGVAEDWQTRLEAVGAGETTVQPELATPVVPRDFMRPV